MVQTPSKPLTLEEFLQQPETKPAREYLHDRIVQKPMPQGKHSKIQYEFLATVNSKVKPLRVALAFPELRCTFSGRSIVPDIVVLQWDRIPLDDRGEVANTISTYPDWTIEILSPQNNKSPSQTRVTDNILHCLEAGCHLGWLIDPDERCVLVFPPGKQPKIYQEEQDILPVPEFIGELQLSVGQVFGWLKLY